MEFTGKYWFPIHNILEDCCHVVVSHPKFVKAIKGKKTDKKDAQWIADLFKHDLVRGSFIPPKNIRQLRDLCRYWVKFSSYMTGEKNRAQNCLTVSNFKLDDVFSNVFGKSASAITTQLLEHPGEPFDVPPPLYMVAAKRPLHKFRRQLTVSSPTNRPKKPKIIRSHMDSLEKHKAGQYLKPLLVQCAFAAVKSKKKPYFAIKYQRLVKRRGKKKAIIAIARMMLTSIYHMLSNDEDFHPADYEATVNPPKQKPVVLTLDNTLQFLREQGDDPETLKLIQ